MAQPHHEFTQDHRLRKEERLCKRAEFLQAQREGGKFVTPHLVVYARAGDQPWARLGLTVSRKVGNAVVRNKVKRRLREAFRNHKRELPAAIDLVVIARSESPQAPLEALTRELIEAAHRALKRRQRPPGRAEAPKQT